MPRASTALSRVAEEATQNVITHAGVDQVHVGVVDETVVCRVLDEGRGFHVHRHRAGSAGLRLLSMAERIRQVGGQLQLESEPGKGTHLEVQFPCVNPKRMVRYG